MYEIGSYKAGGTSVGSPENLEKVVGLLEREELLETPTYRNKILVVSASASPKKDDIEQFRVTQELKKAANEIIEKGTFPDKILDRIEGFLNDVWFRLPGYSDRIGELMKNLNGRLMMDGVGLAGEAKDRYIANAKCGVNMRTQY